MAIQMRRGLKKDFDPAKMLPGEWAVSIDNDTQNQIVWMCFAPGVTKRMGTYEDFKKQIEEATGEIKEEYLAEFRTILDRIEELAEQTSENTDTVIQIRDDAINIYLPQMLEYLKSAENRAGEAEASASAAATSATNAENTAREMAEALEAGKTEISEAVENGSTAINQALESGKTEISDYVDEAESYAHGGTGTRVGEDEDNAKYYSDQAKEYYENLSQAGTVTGVKGDAESGYRQGNVNITAQNVGAVPLSGGEMTGNLIINNDFVGYGTPALQVKNRQYPDSTAAMGVDSEGPFVRLKQTDDEYIEVDTYKSATAGGFRIYKHDTDGNNTFFANLDANGKFNINGNADTVDGKHAEDLQDYNNLTNKPASLPANGGNADYATSAGSANAVAWDNVSGKPTTYAPSAHTHDDRYYTEAEVNTLLAGKIQTTASCNKNWNWAGQSGQPTWVWGGNDNVNEYVYNPTNFVVTAARFVRDVNGDYNAIMDTNGNYRPILDNTQSNGTPSCRWKQVYAGTANILTSDRNYKDNIRPLTERHIRFFMLLAPVSFTFTDGASGRTHIGFISQDVEAAMTQVGLTDLDFAGFCRDEKVRSYLDDGGNEVEEPVLDDDGNPEYIYSLRYEEFIALITYALQMTISRMDDLEERLEAVEKSLN